MIGLGAFGPRPRRPHSQRSDASPRRAHGAVARGDASVYLRLPTRADYVEKIWDHAAGSIVVREAGGQVTDVYGNELDFSLGRTLENNKGVIVSNGRLHDRVIGAVKEVLGL